MIAFGEVVYPRTAGPVAGKIRGLLSLVIPAAGVTGASLSGAVRGRPIETICTGPSGVELASLQIECKEADYSGTLAVFGDPRTPLSSDQRAALETVAGQISLIFELEALKATSADPNHAVSPTSAVSDE